jgi:hypothetical protein
MNYAPSLIPAATSDNLEDPIPADCALAKEEQKRKQHWLMVPQV